MLSSEIQMSKEKFQEKSLAEIGFNSTDISDWDQIVQPKKTSLLDLLERMIKNYEKTNIKIQINETTFNCHLMVLQCYSDFFRELNNEQTVVLPADKVTSQSFIMIYDWMLASDSIVRRDCILELFNAAKYLKIKELENQCWICLDDDQRISEDSAFLLYLEARKFGNEPIQNLMLTRIFKFFLTLVSSKEFLELSVKEVCTLLSSNGIGVNSETEVFMSAVRWLTYDWKKRQKYLLDVMKNVRFGLMVPWQIVELRRNSDSEEIGRVVQDPEIQKMIDDGLSYVTTKYWYANNSESLFNCMDRLNLIEPAEREWIRDSILIKEFGLRNEIYSSYSFFLEYIDRIRKMGKDHWKNIERQNGNTNLNKRNESDKGRTNTKETLVIKYSPHIGANTTTKLETDVFQKNINISTNRSVDCRPLEKKSRGKILQLKTYVKNIQNTPICAYKLSVNSYILIFGGIDPHKPSTADIFGKTVSNYNWDSKTWENLTTMPGSRHHHSAVICSGKIYIMGGTKLNASNTMNRIALSNTMWSFDPSILEWKIEPDLPLALRDFAAVSTAEGIYMIGGEDNGLNLMSSTFYYSASESCWSEKSSMNISRSGITAVLADNVIWAAGGLTNRYKLAVTDCIEAYCINTQKWTEVGHLKVPRAFARISSFGHNMYIIGGADVVKQTSLKSLAEIERFDYLTKNCLLIGNLITPRHGHDVINLNNEVWILGGICSEKDQTLSSIECFSLRNGECKDKGIFMNSQLSGFCAVSYAHH